MSNKIDTKKVSKKEFDTLLESPNLYKFNIERKEDWEGNNEELVKQIESSSKYEGKFGYYNQKYKIYIKKENDYIFYNLISDEYPTLMFLHEIKLEKLKNLNGIISVDIWQNHVLKDFTRGLGRYWIFEYILKNYDFIMSDSIHTPLGKIFWKKLMEESQQKNLYIVVYDVKDKKYFELEDINDIEKYYDSIGKSNFRFVILNKTL